MSPRSPTWKRSFRTWGEEGDAGINIDPSGVIVKFGDVVVFHVSWRAAEAFAACEQRADYIVDLDGGKTGEELDGQ
jgi:hypothetical protein